MIWFDTRDGNATIMGRVYNSIEGRPATIEEIDPIGQYILNTHLNVSNEPITPESWLNFCEGLDQDVNMPEGIYILPVNDSKYNYTLVDGKIIRSLNIPTIETAPETVPVNETEPEKVVPAARKERAAK
jgi:hypothetical protein